VCFDQFVIPAFEQESHDQKVQSIYTQSLVI
jgi:5-formyltetrahydrofolate cyclo-ligase